MSLSTTSSNLVQSPKPKFKTGPLPATPPKPTAIEPQLDSIPLELRERTQWVCWRYEWEDGRWNKTPYNPQTRYKASTTNPDTWSSFKLASAVYRKGGFDGVGYVFSPNDPYCGVDFDHILEEVDGDKIIKPDVREWIERFDSYTEYSVSGNGLHVIIRAKPSSRFNNHDVGRELYDQGRYFCFTGDSYHYHLEPKPIGERREVTEDFIRAFDPKIRNGASGARYAHSARSAHTSACGVGGGGFSLLPTEREGEEGEHTHTTRKSVRSTGALPLSLEDINYDSSNPFDTWKAGLLVVASSDPSARWNASGNVDVRAKCHDGNGGKGLFLVPSKNRISCNRRCSISKIAEAYGYPLPPKSDEEEKESTKVKIQRTP